MTEKLLPFPVSNGQLLDRPRSYGGDRSEVSLEKFLVQIIKNFAW